MSYIYKGIVLLYTIVSLIIKKRISYQDIVLLLLLFSLSFSLNELSKPWIFLIIEGILVILASIFSSVSICFMMIVLFDCVLYKNYIITILSSAVYLVPNLITLNETSFVLMAIAILCGVYDRKLQENKELFNQTIDSERQLRYELEKAKKELEVTSKQIERITEVRERNRIAREIHDNAGHNLAAINIQLQAINKLIDNEPAKAKIMLDVCTSKVKESLEMIRHTVHNIRSVENVGITKLKSLVEQFKYCNATFKHSGNFSNMCAMHYQILELVLKEALTNIAKHSQADCVTVTIISTQDEWVLTIQDNGQGFVSYSKGIGIKNMQERVLNAGGSFNISSGNGVEITVLLKKGGEVVERSFSR